jgi:leader peptidase (prepilin peptidase) / N-methyltransferase
VTGPAVLALGGLMGLAAGSFVTTAALRRARNEQFSRGRSHCDGCGLALGFLQTTPVLSYIGARGACRSCGARIDPLHPVGEVTGGLIGIGAVLAPPDLDTLLVAGLGFTLWAAAVVDARTRRLPDVLTAAAAAFCLVLGIRHGREAILAGVIASGCALLILTGLRALRSRQGRDPGLGFGDVKLVCALALWLGALTPWMVLAAAVLALGSWRLVRPQDGKMAFGPAIALAGFGLGLAMEGGWWPATI